MYPTQHYRFLPPFLRALDRAVCVSSGANIFPLPQTPLQPLAGGMNGVSANASTNWNNLGSDESLGGALLTPIPWLKPERAVEDGISPTQAQALNQLHGQPSQGKNELKSEETEMVDGPNGVGRIETVSVVNGVLSSMSPSAAAANAGSNPSSPQTSPTRAQQADGAAGAAAVSTASVESSLREAGAVTQGELIRLEQEAGVVPVSVASRTAQRQRAQAAALEARNNASREGAGEASAATAVDAEAGDTAQEDVPHARGPTEITAEDVGPGHENIGSPGALDLEKAAVRGIDNERAVDVKKEAGIEDAKDEAQDHDVGMEDVSKEATKDEDMSDGLKMDAAPSKPE
jgi:hypothetical protein